MIEAEQQANPALDTSENVSLNSGECGYCPYGGSPVSPCGSCPYTRNTHPLAAPTTKDATPEEDFNFMMGGSDDHPDDYSTANNAPSILDSVSDISSLEQYDPIMLAAAPESLQEQLMTHLVASSETPADAAIIEYLVDSLDEQGYLRMDMAEVCAVLNVTPQLVDAGIKRLQSSEPSGIGARNLHECLLLQLTHLRDIESENYDNVAHVIVRDYWELFTQRRNPQLARRLGVPLQRIEQAIAFIQSELSPYPAGKFRTPWNNRPDTISEAIKPDVIISRTPNGFKVELAGMEGVNLQVNPYYRGIYEKIRKRRNSTSINGVNRELQKHIIDYVERADLFLKNIQRRQWTIQRIALALVDHQVGFLETGKKTFLRPLTRTQLAQILEMHESTISRALLHKYVQLPSQEVVSFDIFFGHSTNAKEAVASLIANENPSNPLSDQTITKALNERGINVARRTVVKYREELRIPASYLRRQR